MGRMTVGQYTLEALAASRLAVSSEHMQYSHVVAGKRSLIADSIMTTPDVMSLAHRSARVTSDVDTVSHLPNDCQVLEKPCE
jgi:hypothetical protein